MDSASTILGLVPGDVVEGKYELVRRVGHGGMGTVWEARSVALGRAVALKFLHPEMAQKTNLVQRFLREARAAANVTHPAVVYVFDIGWVDGGKIPYFAMEYLEGKSLAGVLRASGPFEVGRAVWVVCRVLEALEAAHAKGVVHRDLKPENVFLVSQGADDIVKVLDFGISKVLGDTDAALTGTGVILGTPSYMSPEQVRCSRDVDARCDLYAVGAILYELLSGGPAFAGGSFTEVVYKILNDPPRPLVTTRPGLDESLVRVIDRALKKDPDDRWPSAAEMRAGLRSASAVESKTAALTLPVTPQALQETPFAWDASSPGKKEALCEEETVATPPPFESTLSVRAAVTTGTSPSEDGPTTTLPIPGSSTARTGTRVRRGPSIAVLAVAAVAAVLVGGGAALLLRAPGVEDRPATAVAPHPLLPPPPRPTPIARPEPSAAPAPPPPTEPAARECRIQVTVSPPGARVRIDGELVAAPVDLPATCGSFHALRVEAPGHRPFEQMIELEIERTWEIRLEALVGRARSPSPSPRLEPNPF
ncbi:MAG: serine/threonine protein kinase [Deltaproteobacteria bacterium]|nr:serine/threonine protein kinase [Deltaproteobacteria bacterium]